MNAGQKDEAFVNYQKAIDYFTTSVSFDTTFLHTFLNRGTTYVMLNKFNLAALDFEKALMMDKGNPDILEKRAYSYNMSNQFDKALEDYNKLIQEKPENKYLYLNRGIAYYNLAKYKEAIPDLENFVQNDATNGNAYFYLAYSYHNNGDNVKAVVYLEKARQAGYKVSESDYQKLRNKK